MQSPSELAKSIADEFYPVEDETDVIRTTARDAYVSWMTLAIEVDRRTIAKELDEAFSYLEGSKFDG